MKKIQNCSCLQEMQGQKWIRASIKGHQETAPTWDLSHVPASNSDTIADATLCLQTGAWYDCSPRDSTTTRMRQMKIYTGNHWTKPRNP